MAVCRVGGAGTVHYHLCLGVYCPQPQPTAKPTPTIERFKGVLTDKTIVKVIMTSVFWTISNHIVVSFFGTYQVNELGFSMKFITIISILNAFSRVPCSFVFGKYADKYSFAKMRGAPCLSLNPYLKIVISPYLNFGTIRFRLFL